MKDIRCTQFTEVQTLVTRGYTVIPVESEFIAGLETPFGYYARLSGTGRPTFLLESAEGSEQLARYTVLGLVQEGVLTFFGDGRPPGVQTDNPAIQTACAQIGAVDPFSYIQELLRRFRSPSQSRCCGLVGTLAYDTVRYIEPTLATRQRERSELPEAVFFFTGDQIIFDNQKHLLKLVSTIYIRPDITEPELQGLYTQAVSRLLSMQSDITSYRQPAVNQLVPMSMLQGEVDLSHWHSNCTQSEFEQMVETAKEHIRAGDIFQIVPSQRFTRCMPGHVNSLQLYQMLRSVNPSPYMFHFDLGGVCMVGSSPEVMVKSSRTDDTYTAILRPIAGTIKRGASEAEDESLINKLKADPKELAEHLMLVDLARNDLGRIAVPGTVRPNGELMFIEKYSHIIHIVSEIICNVDRSRDAIDILRAVFPAGTLTGAPKVKAMDIISHLESSPRDYYGGCTGLFGFDGSCNTCMTIRTMLLTPTTTSQNSTDIRIQAGAGIVYDSVPTAEYHETINKAAALIKVVNAYAHLVSAAETPRS